MLVGGSFQGENGMRGDFQSGGLSQSASSSPGGGPSNSGFRGDGFCGDFQRGVCTRGDSCKYQHATKHCATTSSSSALTSLLSAAALLPSAEEMTKFITESGIDERAVRELQSEAASVQRLVLDGGPMQAARNPSAALVGRIRDAKQKLLQQSTSSCGSSTHRGFSETDPNAPADGQVGANQIESAAELIAHLDRFIDECNLDDRAARELKNEPAQIQREVLALGPVLRCSNPSAALIGRLRDLKARSRGLTTGPTPTDGYASGQGMGPSAADSRRPETNEDLSEELDKFISESNLDERAARELKAEPSHIQREVMALGPVLGCTNASASLIGRLRDIKKGARGHHHTGQTPTDQYAFKQQTHSSTLQTSGDQMQPGHGFWMMPAGMMTGYPGMLGGSQPANCPSAEEVESFGKSCGADDRAIQALKSEAGYVQAAVLGRGPLLDANNPSATLMARINQAKKDGQRTGAAQAAASAAANAEAYSAAQAEYARAVGSMMQSYGMAQMQMQPMMSASYGLGLTPSPQISALYSAYGVQGQPMSLDVSLGAGANGAACVPLAPHAALAEAPFASATSGVDPVAGPPPPGMPPVAAVAQTVDASALFAGLPGMPPPPPGMPPSMAMAGMMPAMMGMSLGAMAPVQTDVAQQQAAAVAAAVAAAQSGYGFSSPPAATPLLQDSIVAPAPPPPPPATTAAETPAAGTAGYGPIAAIDAGSTSRSNPYERI